MWFARLRGQALVIWYRLLSMSGASKWAHDPRLRRIVDGKIGRGSADAGRFSVDAAMAVTDKLVSTQGRRSSCRHLRRKGRGCFGCEPWQRNVAQGARHLINLAEPVSATSSAKGVLNG